jgi:hypothetical protein
VTVLRRLLSCAAVGGLLVLCTAVPAAAADQPPYKDPAAVGTITLCDDKGHQVTQGDTRDLPFAFFAISSQPAKGAYAVKQGKATLYAFQARKDVDPGDWSGQQLSGSSFYSTTKHPMAQITTGDHTLSQDVASYPTQWDGFVQLRMYLQAPNQTQYSDTYPTVNLKISGTTWVAVDPGSTSCSAGKARSTETLVLPASAFPGPSKAGSAAAPTSSPSGTSTSSSSPASPGGVAAGGDASPAASTGTSSSSTILLGLLLVAVVGVAVAAWVLARGRRTPTSPNG